MADNGDDKLSKAQELIALEQQSLTNDAKKIELAQELRKLTAAEVNDYITMGGLTDKLTARLEQIRDDTKQTAEHLNTQVKNLDKATKRLDKMIAASKTHDGILKSSYKTAVLTEERNRTAIELRQAQIREMKQLVRLGGEKGEQAAKELADLVKLDRRLQTFGGKASDIAQGLFSGDASAMTGALKGIGASIKGDMSTRIKEAVDGADSLSGGLKAAGKQMAALALFTLIEQTLSLAIAMGDAENAFMKATGASEDFARSISDTYEEGRKFTATVEDMSKAATSLFNNFTDFTYQDKATRDSLIETGAVLDKLGISNENFAQAVQISTKGLGMSAEQAGQSMLDLEKYAEELGVSPEKLSSQFLEAGDAMQKLGENGDEAFRDLAAAAKVTGLSVTKLLNIVNQFDTFEGAARQAGKLNAALGGNFVNAMDLMMETDPTARFEQIRDAILDTGLSFDSMSYYQKNFYKDAMGLDSVGDLALVLSGNMDSVSEATKKTSQEYEDAAARAKTVASFQEQLNAAFAQMIPILTPLIDAFRGLMTFVSENITTFKILGATLLVAFGGIPGIVIAIIGLLDAMKMGEERVSVLSALLQGFMYPISAIGDAFAALKEKMVEAIGGTEKFAAFTEKLIPIVKTIGAVIGFALLIPLAKVIGVFAAITIGVTAFTTAIAKLMGAFKKKNSPSFFDMFTGGMLGKAIEALMIPFNAFKGMLENIAGIFESIMGAVSAFFTALTDPGAAANIEKIAAAIAEVPRTNALALGRAMAQTGETLKIQASVGNNEVMNTSMETAAGLSEATFNRTAAPTAASTNISQNSSNSKATYINQGPQSLIVKAGNQTIAEITEAQMRKNLSDALTGRGVS